MKHVSILIPQGHSSLSNIEGTHHILSEVNSFRQGMGLEPLFRVQLVGLSRANTQRNGLFTVSPDLLIDELENSEYEHFKPQSLTTPPVWQAPAKVYVTAGQKQYELGNHLGNVISTVSDRKVSKEEDVESGALTRYYPEVRLATEYYPFGSPLVNWGCSEGVQCSTSVQTSLTPVVISNFVNLVQKNTTQTELTPGCIGASRAATCVQVSMEGSATRGDGAYLNLRSSNTGMQQLASEIVIQQQDYMQSMKVYVLKMDTAGFKVLDTLYTGIVDGIPGDTVKHTVSFYNDNADNVFQVRYKKVVTGATTMQWMKVTLNMVTETYVRNCDNTPGAGGYRYLFNGQEKENDLYGIEGSAYTFEYRIHDPRLGRFFSVDPLQGDYPYQSTYCFASNNPIALIDALGLGPEDPNDSGNHPKPTEAGTREGQLGAVYANTWGVGSGPAHWESVYHTGSKKYAAGWYTREDYKNLISDLASDWYTQADGKGNFPAFAGIPNVELDNAYDEALYSFDPSLYQYKVDGHESGASGWAVYYDSYKQEYFNKQWPASGAIQSAEFEFVSTVVPAFKGAYAITTVGFKLAATEYVTWRLNVYTTTATQTTKLTSNQIIAVGRRPYLYNTFMGTQIDFAVKERVSSSLITKYLIRSTPQFQYGPDFYSKSLNTFWDIGTRKSWGVHYKYTSQFGKGVPIYWR